MQNFKALLPLLLVEKETVGRNKKEREMNDENNGYLLYVDTTKLVPK